MLVQRRECVAQWIMESDNDLKNTLVTMHDDYESSVLNYIYNISLLCKVSWGKVIYSIVITFTQKKVYIACFNKVVIL